MALAGLPTELDERIIGYLYDPDDRRALHSTVRLSKYYRALTEPVLYGNLTFTDANEAQIKRLLITLLERKDLAKHIKTVTTFYDPSISWYYDNTKWFDDRGKISHEFWKHAGSLQNEITLRSRYLTAEFSMAWFGSLFTRAGRELARRPSLDGALALLLTLAINIETINLHLSEYETLDITREALAAPWHNPSVGLPVQPFRKLVALQIHGTSPIKQPLGMYIRSSAQSLQIRDCQIAATIIPSAPVTTLRVLEMINTKIGPKVMEDTIASPVLCNLRELRLNGITSWIGNWKTFNFSNFSKSLVQHVPQLHVFECTHMEQPNGFPQPFGSFKRLTELHTLRVDFDLLIGAEARNGHFDDQAMFPPSLKHLELTQIRADRLDTFREFYDEGYDRLRGSWQFLACSVPAFGLESFTLEVFRDQSSPEDPFPEAATLQRLKLAADESARRGLKYSILECGRDPKDARKLLVAPESKIALLHEEQI